MPRPPPATMATLPSSSPSAISYSLSGTEPFIQFIHAAASCRSKCERAPRVQVHRFYRAPWAGAGLTTPFSTTLGISFRSSSADQYPSGFSSVVWSLGWENRLTVFPYTRKI